jgi:hypothetical protein
MAGVMGSQSSNNKWVRSGLDGPRLDLGWMGLVQLLLGRSWAGSRHQNRIGSQTTESRGGGTEWPGSEGVGVGGVKSGFRFEGAEVGGAQI